MRVLHLINSFSRGGAEVLVFDLAHACRTEESLVCAVSSVGEERERPLRRQLEADGIQSFSLIERGRDWISRGRRLRELVMSERPDVVHAHVISPVALAHASISGPRRIFSFHAERLVGPYRRRARATEAALAWSAHHAIAVSTSTRQAALARTFLPAGRISVIPNGVELERFTRPGLSRGNARVALGIPEDAPLLAVVARVDPNKGHDVVLDALALLRRQHPDARAVFAGSLEADPAWAAAMRAKAEVLGLSGAVSFPGPLDDVPSLLRAADVAISASHSESFGLAAVEAMLSGVPLVATDLPSHREITRGGTHCRLVKPGDPRALAEALAAALDGELSSGLAAARAHAGETFDIHAVARRHLVLYERILSSTGRAANGR